MIGTVAFGPKEKLSIAMPPKRNSKRKSPQPSTPALGPDRAPEPVIAAALGTGTAQERVVVDEEIVRAEKTGVAVSPPMPVLEDLLLSDADLLASI